MSRPIQRVEDYTTTCLVMGFVNLLWIFVALWGVWGLPAVLVVSVALNSAINRLAPAQG